MVIQSIGYYTQNHPARAPNTSKVATPSRTEDANDTNPPRFTYPGGARALCREQVPRWAQRCCRLPGGEGQQRRREANSRSLLPLCEEYGSRILVRVRAWQVCVAGMGSGWIGGGVRPTHLSIHFRLANPHAKIDQPRRPPCSDQQSSRHQWAPAIDRPSPNPGLDRPSPWLVAALGCCGPRAHSSKSATSRR